MSPEYLGSNLWELFPGESVVGTSGQQIKGPLVVRVHQFPDVERLRIQSGAEALEVKGSNFADIVSKEHEQ